VTFITIPFHPIVAEILANAITNHKDIKRIRIDDSEYLISQLADDTTLFLEANKTSFNACTCTCMPVLDNFAKFSGLKINYSETLAVKIGLDE
jgi:hypothetical protein